MIPFVVGVRHARHECARMTSVSSTFVRSRPCGGLDLPLAAAEPSDAAADLTPPHLRHRADGHPPLVRQKWMNSTSFRTHSTSAAAAPRAARRSRRRNAAAAHRTRRGGLRGRRSGRSGSARELPHKLHLELEDPLEHREAQAAQRVVRRRQLGLDEDARLEDAADE
jgi:hypothetical protein